MTFNELLNEARNRRSAKVPLEHTFEQKLGQKFKVIKLGSHIFKLEDKYIVKVIRKRAKVFILDLNNKILTSFSIKNEFDAVKKITKFVSKLK